MSAISSIAVITALASIAKAAKPLGARISELAKSGSKTFGQATTRALELAADALAAELPELPSVPNAVDQVARIERAVINDLRHRSLGLKDIDVEKTGVIASVLRAPLAAENLGRVQGALAAVEASMTSRELAAARSRLHEVLATEHGNAWLTTLQEITERAYAAIGFRPLHDAVRAEREIRLSAIDGDGKVLVSELRLGKDGSPSMATEVVNGCGTECEDILAKFENAVAQYVRGTAPVRKPTGGVCQLEAAAAFVRRRVRRAPLPASTSTPSRRPKTVTQKRSS